MFNVWRVCWEFCGRFLVHTASTCPHTMAAMCAEKLNSFVASRGEKIVPCTLTLSHSHTHTLDVILTATVVAVAIANRSTSNSNVVAIAEGNCRNCSSACNVVPWINGQCVRVELGPDVSCLPDDGSRSANIYDVGYEAADTVASVARCPMGFYHRHKCCKPALRLLSLWCVSAAALPVPDKHRTHAMHCEERGNHAAI